MDEFVIEGGRRLTGTVAPSGNKNAALPLLAACLLTDQPITLHNVPRIKDVQCMIQLLRDLGACIEEVDDHTLTISACDISATRLSSRACQEIRGSILLAGPMLARCRQLELPAPGGDTIGRRRLDTHFMALEALGAHVVVGTTATLSDAGPVRRGHLPG